MNLKICWCQRGQNFVSYDNHVNHDNYVNNDNYDGLISLPDFNFKAFEEFFLCGL